MKNLSVVFAGLFFAVNSFAATSLDFGGAGTHLDAKLKVFVDQTAGQPKCMNCVSFSVLVDDLVRNSLGGTNIKDVVVLVRHPKLENAGEFTPYIHRFNALSAVFRHIDSPRMTKQFTLSLPMSGRGTINSAEFQVLALKKRCQNPTISTCGEDLMDVIAEFKGKDVLSLDTVRPTELARD